MSAYSAGAYTATLLVMVNVMRGGGHPPPNVTARTNFTLMIECTPESSVATLCTLRGYTLAGRWGVSILEGARHWLGLLQYNPSTVYKIRIATSATRSSGAEAKGRLPSSSSYWLTATRPRI